MAEKKNDSSDSRNDNQFHITGSEKASQLGPSSPSERRTNHPQAEASGSSGDNDMDRQTNQLHNEEADAEEAQSDGNLSFPEGK